MSIIINGTTIPTNGDYIKYGGTNLTQVDVVRNGVRTTVWKKVTNIDILQNPNIVPYTIYHGPDSISKNENVKTVYHSGQYDARGGKAFSEVRFSNNVIEFLSSNSSPVDWTYPGLKGTQWIEFNLDLTSFKKISLTLKVVDSYASLSAYISSTFSILVDSTKITKDFTIDCNNTWKNEGSLNTDYVTNRDEMTINADISSYTGTKTVRINNTMYDYGYGDTALWVKINDLKFLS